MQIITGGVDEEEHTKIGSVFLFGPKLIFTFYFTFIFTLFVKAFFTKIYLKISALAQKIRKNRRASAKKICVFPLKTKKYGKIFVCVFLLKSQK